MLYHLEFKVTIGELSIRNTKIDAQNLVVSALNPYNLEVVVVLEETPANGVLESEVHGFDSKNKTKE